MSQQRSLLLKAIAAHLLDANYNGMSKAVCELARSKLFACPLQTLLTQVRSTREHHTEGYGLRIKGIHVISSSKAIYVFMTLLKQVFSEKLVGRIVVHKTAESLHEYIPKEILPEDFGGDEKSLKEMMENWMAVLSAPENVAYFKKICKACTNEKYRLAVQYNDQILGMPGSFRALTVD